MWHKVKGGDQTAYIFKHKPMASSILAERLANNFNKEVNAEYVNIIHYSDIASISMKEVKKC